MKIDIHTHTKKCKTGDKATREISPSDFCKKILSTDVKIVAITNHNHFDKKQFDEIQNIFNGAVQVWPGIEIDVIRGDNRGHLLVIVSPDMSDEFSNVVNNLIGETSPDNFSISIEDVFGVLESFHPLYIPHYHKNPKIAEEDIDFLFTNTHCPERILKEVSNAISAGIYIAHGYSSIYGSDVQDWSDYEINSTKLPELRLPVDSFEQFCLLLKKDIATINTILNKKNVTELELFPFDDEVMLKLKVFDDINIIFGPKGTGKSCILAAIEKYYMRNGIRATKYASSDRRIDEEFDIKCSNLEFSSKNYNINDCSNEIKLILLSKDTDITPINRYIVFFKTERTNKNSNIIKIKDMQNEVYEKKYNIFNEYCSAIEKFDDFDKFIESSNTVQEILSRYNLQEFINYFSVIQGKLKSGAWEAFLSWKEVFFLNFSIDVVKSAVSLKTGTPQRPSTTGFLDYAKGRIKIKFAAKVILEALNTTIPMQEEEVGYLGENKGELKLNTEFKFQNGSITDGSFAAKIKKMLQKNFALALACVFQDAFSSGLYNSISQIKSLEDIDMIQSINDLILIKRYFSLDGKAYSPSTGESSMILLQREISENKDIYILDEPERSLGNDYINDVIVPIIKSRAIVGKKVFISTHDANIAVRTLPYSSIYRCHGLDGYKTYWGNPFTNKLINISDESDVLDWKNISMLTLEGGEDAFGERGKIYGKL